MRRLLPVAALAAVGALVAAAVVVVHGSLTGNDAAAPPPTPEAFMERVLRLTVDGRFDEAWTVLHPAHQRIAPREEFVRCRASDPTISGYHLVSARLVAKRYVRIDSPGVPQHTSTQVTLRFEIADASGRTHPAELATVRAVWTDTRWAWVLPDREIPTFRSGRCLPSPPVTVPSAASRPTTQEEQ